MILLFHDKDTMEGSVLSLLTCNPCSLLGNLNIEKNVIHHSSFIIHHCIMRRFLFHNFRILFALSRWTRQHLTSAGLLVFGSLIAAGVFGIDTQKTLAYQLFSLLLVLLLLAILSSLFFKIRLTAQRDLPKFATVGEILHYQIRVQNHSQKLQRNLTLQENFKWHPPSFKTFLSCQRTWV
ncbi:membrane protein [Beggiatoa sp. PS]|nr:membrane protein [Beggiatoa sp. PS]